MVFVIKKLGTCIMYNYRLIHYEPKEIYMLQVNFPPQMTYLPQYFININLYAIK